MMKRIEREAKAQAYIIRQRLTQPATSIIGWTMEGDAEGYYISSKP